MRLDKALSLTGVSRSEAKQMIARGRVRVRGEIARDSGMNVEISDVALDDAPLCADPEIYIMIHKPAGVITATEDPRLPTVVSLLPEHLQKRRIGPIGRLDRDVTGLVILTTDGQLAHRLISPKWKAEKTYRAVCEGRLTDADARAFAEGITLSDFTAKPAHLQILSAGDDQSTADVTLTEGKFHQVKRMFIAAGHPLRALSRLRIGCVALDPALAAGQWRKLSESEIRGLKEMSGLI